MNIAHMNTQTIFVIGFMAFMLGGCKNNQELAGTWAIEEFDSAKPILTNILDLAKDGSCDLPMSDISERHTPLEKGTWRSYKEKGKCYLQITTPNTTFNDTYEVTSYEGVIDSVSWGRLTVMRLQSARTTMLCKRPEYE